MSTLTAKMFMEALERVKNQPIQPPTGLFDRLVGFAEMAKPQVYYIPSEHAPKTDENGKITFLQAKSNFVPGGETFVINAELESMFRQLIFQNGGIPVNIRREPEPEDNDEETEEIV